MSIQSEINRINNAVADAYSSAEEKGATMPSVQNVGNLSSTIQSIQLGAVDSVNGQTGDVLLTTDDIDTANDKLYVSSTEKSTWNGKSDKPASFTLTLTTTWTNNQQTVSDSRLVATGYDYIITPASSSIRAYQDAEIYADDVTTNGQITFHCGTAPTVSITVNVLKVQVA